MKYTLLSLLLILYRQPLWANMSNENLTIGKETPLAQLLTLILCVMFLVIFSSAIIKKIREDGFYEGEGNIKRFGYTSLFLVLLLVVFIISLFATSYTELSFRNGIFQGLRDFVHWLR